MNRNKLSYLTFVEKMILTAIFAILISVMPKWASAQSMYTISASTPANTAIVLATSAADLVDIEIATGAAGNYCVAYDSAAPAVLSGGDTATAKKLGTATISGSNLEANFASRIKRHAVNGVSVICSAALNAIVWITQ